MIQKKVNLRVRPAVFLAGDWIETLKKQMISHHSWYRMICQTILSPSLERNEAQKLPCC